MFKQFTADDRITTQITVTNGFWDGGVGILAGTNYTTASLSTTQKNYYYNVQYNSKDHLSCTYGHKEGSGSAEQSTTVEGTTQAVYKQFYNFTETDGDKLRDTKGFSMIDGTDSTNAVTQSDCYFIVAERLQMKDRLNPGTWTITLSGSNTAGTAGTSLDLTDDSKTTDPLTPGAPFGEKFSIVAGSAGSVTTAATTKQYGFFYPDAGLFVLSANALSSSIPGDAEFKTSGSGFELVGTGLAPDHRVTDAADNAWKITRALELGSVTLRSEEKQYVYDYFCRAKANEFNSTNNVTFWTGSDYQIRHDDMVSNPQTFISEVGLYDGLNNLVAVGRLSSALNKNFSSEAIVKVRLTY